MPMDFINQNILLISIIVVSGIGLIMPMLMPSAGKPLSPQGATQLINRESAVVIDVRDASEFAAGHLPDAKNIPLAKLAERLGELENLKDKSLIVCCASGMRSSKACNALRKAGFADLNELSGGVDAWVAAGYPIKKGAK